MSLVGRLALTVLAIAAVIVIVAITRGSSAYVVRAEFRNVDGLVPATDVRIDGVRVGEVSSLSLTRNDDVIATLSLARNAAPIGRDATVAIRDANLLGAKYVEINPGSRSDPAPSSLLIPESRTSMPVDLDQVLDVLDPSTRSRLQLLINETGLALDGRGSNFSQLLGQLPPALDQTGQLLAQFSSDNHKLGILLDRSSQLVSVLAPQHVALGRLIDSAEGALRSTGARQRQLSATVDRAPATIVQLDETLRQLSATAAPLPAAALALRGSAAPLTGVLRQLPVVRPTAVDTLHQLEIVAPALQHLGTGATPFIERLKPTAAKLTTFAHALDPVTGTIDVGAVNLLRFVEGWARTVQERDAAGHVFRVQVTFSPDLISHLRSSFLDPAPASALARRSSPPTNPPRGSVGAGATSRPAPAQTGSAAGPAQPAGTTAPAGGPLSGVVAKLAGALGALHPSSPGAPPAPGAPSPSPPQNALGQVLKYLVGR